MLKTNFLSLIALTVGLLISQGSFSQNNCLKFDGTNDGMSILSSSSLDVGGTTMSLEVRLKPANLSSTSSSIYELIRRESQFTTGGGWGLQITGQGYIVFWVLDATGSQNTLTSSSALTNNTWTHVAATYDGSQMRILFDGVVKGSTSYSGNVGTGSGGAVLIGNSSGSGNAPYPGSMDELRIWGTARSTQLVDSFHDAEFCGPVTNLKAYYKFDQGVPGGNNASQSMVIDYSGNGNTGLLSNFALQGTASNYVQSPHLTSDFTLDEDTIEGCSPLWYAPQSKFFFVSQIINDTFANAQGCDSIVYLKVDVFPIGLDTVQMFGCDSVVSNSGKVYRKSGIFSESFKRTGMCDSFLRLEITIGHDTTYLDTATCHQYISPSGKLMTETGLYLDTLTSSLGCDSLFKIDLTIYPRIRDSLTWYACDSILNTSQSKWLYPGNFYTDTFASMQGCDSIVSIEVKSLVTYDSIEVVACSFYQSPGGKLIEQSGTYTDTLVNLMSCDSFLNIVVQINKPSHDTIKVFGCGVAEIKNGSQTVTQSGLYYDSLTNSQNCDSVVTYDVTVYHLDNSIETSNDTLTAVLETGSYQWLDCSADFAPISNETNRTFIATVTGSYAVQISDSGCVDTSQCIEVTITGSIAHLDGQVIAFPNPSSGTVYLRLKNSKVMKSVIVQDVLARHVSTQELNQSQASIQLPAAKGWYSIKILDVDGNTWNVRVLRQ